MQNYLGNRDRTKDYQWKNHDKLLPVKRFILTIDTR